MSFNFGDFANKFISGGGLYGMYQNKQADKNASAQQDAYNQQADMQNKLTQQENDRNRKWQEDFFKNSMQWTQDFYNKVGINNVALAGSTGTTSGFVSSPSEAPNQVPKGAGHQSALDYSVQGMQMAAQVTNLKLLTEQMHSVTLDNKYKQYQLDSILNGGNSNTGGSPRGTSVPLPSGSLSNSPRGKVAETKNPVVHNVDATGSGVDSGSSNYISYANTGTGMTPMPSSDVKNNMEDSPYEDVHFAKVFYRGLVSGDLPKPDADPGKGRHWEWSRLHFEWRSVPGSPVQSEIDGVKADIQRDKFKSKYFKK